MRAIHRRRRRSRLNQTTRLPRQDGITIMSPTMLTMVVASIARHTSPRPAFPMAQSTTIKHSTTIVSSPLSSGFPLFHRMFNFPDTDSEADGYGQRPLPSSESLGPAPRMGYPDSSTPTFGDFPSGGGREAYPAWSVQHGIPLSTEEIEDIFLDLTQKFGFQRDSMRNMVSLSSWSNPRIRAPPRPKTDAAFVFSSTS